MIAAADRVLRLLLEVKETGKITVREAADLLDVAPSTAQRLLATMRARGFVSQQADRSYWLGPAMPQSEFADPRVTTASSLVDLYLRELTASTGETTTFVAMKGRFVGYLNCIESSHPYRITSRIGSYIPAHCSAGGMSLLSDLDSVALAALYETGIPSWPESNIKDVSSLRDSLVANESSGVYTAWGTSFKNVASLGVSVRGASSLPIGAITLALPISRFDSLGRLALEAAIKDTAQRISECFLSEGL